ncbi:HIT family protein [Nonomuraea angiospora]|uniref:Histidine triad (HIT) family protein n=1 Tax=Nonomuraea angiospora TaxID=46172 RepID=A0ABR9M2D8_9ACTN|nr:HIT family protein [Nonomuraea angiospora]MBE1586765.1 histidine triad (HIT) family protein [Nonomuraea angiospora]
MPSADRCPFCDYLAGLRPASILEQVAILVTRWQRGQGHVLVIPVAHRPTGMDVAPAEEQQFMDAVRRAARAITAAYDPGGIAVWQNNRVPAQQAVPHAHFHVAGTLPDGCTRSGEVPRLDLDETDGIAKRLSPHL